MKYPAPVPRRRGGLLVYIALAAIAFLTDRIANNYGLRPYLIFPGIGLSAIGLVMSWLLVQDTKHHVNLESA